MNRYLKCYQVVLRTMSPIFIGSGREIGKKEYLFLNQKKVGIPDIQELYGKMRRLGKASSFEDYLLGRVNIDLTEWLKRQRIRMEDVRPHIKYTLDCSDAVIDGDMRKLQVMECMKDAYGNPYIPGSSIKGMLRTILLGADIMKMPDKYCKAKQDLKQSMNNKASRTGYLQKNMRDIEGIAYRIMNREKTKPHDAVNDVLQGLMVSDSAPLSVDSLVLCQKIDVHVKGTEKRLPLLRECIKPDTEICFTITIDSQLCPYTEKDILAAIKSFMDCYYNSFLCGFAGAKKPDENNVFLGGGCGFVSKTVIYSLYGKKEGMDIVPRIFEKTKVPSVHKHHLDKGYGVSPHTMKCTRYRGKLYQMGLCRIEKIDLM
ncbi:MAG: type III-A CRISPR-associated RAMP protein Csm5 [Lachnospiraceae bacterium]|nr:type III-A CRISPR-associated RAMP protein Csm5 [Lachnospiraceae bacterium]